MSEPIGQGEPTRTSPTKSRTRILGVANAPRVSPSELSSPTNTDIVIPSVSLFTDTPFQIDIAGSNNLAEGEELTQSITGESLQAMPIQEYIQSVVLLSRFGSEQHIGELLNDVVSRLTPAGDFINKLYFSDPIKDANDFEKRQKTYIDSTHIYAGGLLGCLSVGFNNEATRLSPENVKTLYLAGLAPNVYLSLAQFLPFAIEYDRRNEPNGTSLHAREAYVEEASRNVRGELPKIPLPNHNYADDVDQQFANIFMYEPEILEDVLTTSIATAENEKEMRDAITRVGNFIGFTGVRRTLREYAYNNPSFKPAFKKSFRLMGMDLQDEIEAGLSERYDKVDFSSYGPYEELLPFEISLLKDTLSKDSTILDAGCGKGRHLTPLREEGFNVSGFDVDATDIEEAQKKNQDANIRIGSWDKIPFESDSFDTVLCLGRGAAHNLSVEEWLNFFDEGQRVLKSDGSMIIDLPDPNSGEYKEYIEQAKEAAINLGIFLMKPGEVNDSPDGKQFFDRFIIDPQRLTQIARLAGFRAEILSSREYNSANNSNTNKNLYYRLTKMNPPEELSLQEKEDILKDIYSGLFSKKDINRIMENLQRRGMLTQQKKMQITSFFQGHGISS